MTLLDSARHVIQRLVNPRFLSQMASYDVASTIHQSLGPGRVRHQEAQVPGGAWTDVPALVISVVWLIADQLNLLSTQFWRGGQNGIWIFLS